MRFSSAAQASLLVALAAVFFTAEAQSRNRITVKTYKTNYRVDTWDDGRDDLYRVTYWKFGLQSVYTFDAGGHVKTLTARDTRYTFALAGTSRMLMDSDDDAIEDAPDVEASAEIGCSTCEVTWDTLCDVGLTEVCFLDDNTPGAFDEDAQNSVKRFCAAVGAACETSAVDTCDGQCTDEEPAPAPTPTDNGACDPNPCENGGSCAIDPAGGHICSCTSGHGGTFCQYDTSFLDPFFIEVDFLGTWTNARRAVFQSAADRWAEVITHVPCGGFMEYPAGRLLISATLAEIDGPGQDGVNTVGNARPLRVWSGCPTVSFTGEMNFDLYDIGDLEADGSFEAVIVHEMGHVIGVGTLWGPGLGDCSTCLEDGSSTWTCPAALSAYADIGGSGANIIETDFGDGSRCGHLDETLFDNELMTPVLGDTNPLSKMTAAILEDIHYIVDPSAVDPYVLPSERGGSVVEEPEPSAMVKDTAVEVTVQVVDSDGNVVDEKKALGMEF